MDIGLYDALCLEYVENENIREENSENSKRLSRAEVVAATIKDVFDSLGIEKMDELQLNNLDDALHEWADNNVDIYNYHLYRKAAIFSEYIEDALAEFGYDEKKGLVGILSMGQYFFYESLGREILQQLENYLDIE